MGHQETLKEKKEKEESIEELKREIEKVVGELERVKVEKRREEKEERGERRKVGSPMKERSRAGSREGSPAIQMKYTDLKEEY